MSVPSEAALAAAGTDLPENEEIREKISEQGDLSAVDEDRETGTSQVPGEDGSAAALVRILLRQNMTLSTCESCTGGLLAAKLTSVPGVSSVYAGGFVTYTVETKHALAGVSRKLLKKEGAVSKKTARHMARNTAEKTGTDCALSVTGNAGPDPSEEKPVGLVYIGCTVDQDTEVEKCLFEGDRQQIREQAAEEAIRLLTARLEKTESSL